MIPTATEDLPDYSSFYYGDQLPFYSSQTKEFIIKRQSFSFKIPSKAKWSIQEKESGLIWFKVHPIERGLILMNADHNVYFKSILIPIYNKGIGFQIIDPNSNEIKGDIKPIDNQNYKVITYNLQIDEINNKSYVIQRITPRFSNLILWKLFSEEDFNNVLCSFNIDNTSNRLAVIRLKDLKLMDFQIFLICSQIVSLFYS